MKWIDIPPVWLLGHIACVWGLSALPFARFGTGWSHSVGTGSVVAGIALIVVAVFQMWRHRTTPIPHMMPQHLVSDGVFALSRNPIYLGDALILFGIILRADSMLGLVVLPVFIALITQRFIKAEELRLQTAFGPSFVDYCTQTRRWL